MHLAGVLFVWFRIVHLGAFVFVFFFSKFSVLVNYFRLVCVWLSQLST